MSLLHFEVNKISLAQISALQYSDHQRVMSYMSVTSVSTWNVKLSWTTLFCHSWWALERSRDTLTKFCYFWSANCGCYTDPISVFLSTKYSSFYSENIIEDSNSSVTPDSIVNQLGTRRKMFSSLLLKHHIRYSDFKHQHMDLSYILSTKPQDMIDMTAIGSLQQHSSTACARLIDGKMHFLSFH